MNCGPEAPDASRGHLAAGRQRLLREAARGTRTRGLRVRRRFAVAGAVAAITAVAVIGTQVTGGTDSVRPGTGPAYTFVPGSAKALLNDAANAIAATLDVTARDGQWIYTKRNLPDDPAKVRAKVRAKARAFFYTTDDSETRTEHEYRALTVVLSRAYAYDAEGLAKVYRALAAIAGVRAAQVQDAAGRDAIALYLKGYEPGGNRNETLIDPSSHLCTGSRYVAQSDSTDWQQGDVIMSDARLTPAVVDKKGEQP